MVYKLKKPVEINGEETKEIAYDFDSLTGKDFQEIDKEMRQKGIVMVESTFDNVYLLAVFARAAGLASEDLEQVSGRDYLAIARETKTFFLQDMAE